RVEPRPAVRRDDPLAPGHYRTGNEGSRPMRMPGRLALLVPLAGAWIAIHAHAAGPVFSDDGPDPAADGKAPTYPVGPRLAAPLPQPIMVGTYSHWDDKYPYRTAARAVSPSPLRRAPEELSLSYTYKNAHHDLIDYLSRHPVTGLLIARGDTMLFEHY